MPSYAREEWLFEFTSWKTQEECFVKECETTQLRQDPQSAFQIQILLSVRAQLQIFLEFMAIHIDFRIKLYFGL